MWLDNASEVDILFYEPYADVIAGLAKNKDYKPLTIGVFGVWGAGKSTLLNLVQQKIQHERSEDKKTICISINAWTFEGYEDAKVALMESLLSELKDSVPEKAKKGIIKLLKKIDYFKLATKAVSVGAPIAASIAMGNPLPMVLGLSGSAESIGEGVKSAANALQDIQKNYLKDDDSGNEENSVVNNVRKFKEEFAKSLEDEDIENVIVLIDDLDRCQPDRIIETLEAIKLFLSVNKMTFIIAADENVIQYAIRKQYPALGNYAVNLDKEYIEKIIQLPIYIPELSSKDIENYLMLLVAQQYIAADRFSDFIQGIKAKKLMISEDLIDLPKLNELTEGFIHGDVEEEYGETAAVIAGIKNIVAGNLKGNPRQTKRFLNTFTTKRKLAEFYYGKGTINHRILAKLLVLQKLDNDLFIQLNEWNKRFTTENEEFKAMRLNVTSDGETDEKYNNWRIPSIVSWLKSEPVALENERLDRYFYLTRENLKKADVDESTLSIASKEILQRFGNVTRGLVDSLTNDFKKLSPLDQNDVFNVLFQKIEKGEMELYIVRNLFVEFETYRDKLISALEKYPTKIAPSSIAALKKMREVDSDKVDSLLSVWKKTGVINKQTIDSIQGKGAV